MPKTKAPGKKAIPGLQNTLKDPDLSKQEYIRVQAVLMKKQELKALVYRHKPAEYGYTQDFWSIPILKDFVKTKFKVAYKSEKSYQDLFAFCGFSYQKAEHIDHRKDETDPQSFKVRLRKRLKKGAFSMSW